ncbi:MAG: hypothetical protein HY903_21145 [Deltaproteobacteria bacterium]|nr:hypothetical protein [Deltaproteobacteria bacterium]
MTTSTLLNAVLSLSISAALVGCGWNGGGRTPQKPAAPSDNDGSDTDTWSDAGAPSDHDATADGGGSASCDPGRCGAAGCCGPACCGAGIVPANARDFGQLLPTGLVVGPPNGTFDTDTDCAAGSVLGACQAVTVSDSASVPEACVCRMDELTIGSLVVTGARALVIYAWRSVTVNSLLSVAAQGPTRGPGASREVVPAQTGYSFGGAGGVFASKGGGNPLDTYGSPSLVPLIGGCDGQDSANAGGGGGGALQVSAGVSITIAGDIHAGGGGGSAGRWTFADLAGAGGGSGGAVLLEAAQVIVQGTIAANGGGGGGGGSYGESSGQPGQDGQLSLNAATGGAGNDGYGCSLYGHTSGGDGGAGSVLAGDGKNGGSYDEITGCIGGTAAVGAGGGGGGAGRIRVNTITGCVCAGNFSPPPSMGSASAP